LKRGTVSSETGLKIIDQALKRLEGAQEEYLEETISMISEKKEAVQIARRFLDEEKYEQAISSLDALSEREESHEIKELREQAVESLINRERNRAAKIFLTARRTQDPEKKEEYLRSSFNILKALIEKYPSSPLINKVKSHLEKVEEELEKL
jgi:outer membrane protein assembly factor BamD (BamD/ComL family)